MSEFSVPRTLTRLKLWVFASVLLLLSLLMLINPFIGTQTAIAQANTNALPAGGFLLSISGRAPLTARADVQTPLVRTVTIPSNFLTAVDSDGVNDVNAEQNDLTQMGRDDSNPLYYDLFWSWDTTNFTAQKGNACALFDTNNDGNINYAVCAEVENVPTSNPTVVMQTAVSPLAVTCSDGKADRCTQPSNPLSFTTNDIQSGDLASLAASPSANLVTNTDPFPNVSADQTWPNDSTIRLKLLKSFLPANATLVNVCVYPSLGNTGNNNPSDCILVPSGGFLKIVKVAPGGVTQVFNFTVNPGAISKNITGAGTTGAFPVPTGTAYSVAETVPTGWQLDSAVCTLESGAATGATSSSTVSGITVQSGKVTTCTFTNSVTVGALKITKTVDAGGSSFTSGSFGVHVACTNPVNAYDQTISYPTPGNVTISGIPSGSSCTVTETSKPTAPTGYSWDAETISPNPVTITTGGTANVTVANKLSLIAAPSLSITKTPATQIVAAGGTATFQIEVKNTGNVALTGVTMTDAQCTTLTPDASNTTALAVGASNKWTCTVTNVTTGFTNTATADSDQTAPQDATATVNVTKLSLTKNATPNTYDHVGQIINYTLVATNDGNVTLTNVSITDPKVTPLTCDKAAPVTLASGASLTCTGTYVITQADLDARHITNTANAAGQDTQNQTVNSPPASITVNAAQNSHLTLVKTANPTNYDHVGQVIAYTLVATNDGNVTLTNVNISDPKLGALTCTQPVTLAPNGSLTCTGSYTVTQADLDAGKVDNTASAAGVDPQNQTVPATANASVLATQTPHLALTKTAAPTNFSTVGQVIAYTLVATNDGNVTLTSVSINDPKLGALTCAQPVTLAPSGTLTCTGSYTITQADLDAGKVDNTATVTGTPPTGAPISTPANATVAASQTVHLRLTKSANPSSYSKVGDIINYTLVATNDGNVTLTGVSINDPTVGTLSCTPQQPVTLAPAATLTCTASHTITQADLDAGQVNNTATATGSGPQNQPASATDNAVVSAAQSSHLTLTKTASPAVFATVNQVIAYTLVATNDGNVTLTGVSISDPKLNGLSCTPAQPMALAPGETVTCTGSYTITQADVDAGVVNNTATATGTPPTGPAVSATASASVPGEGQPHLALTKSANPISYSHVGDIIHYTLVATNDGALTLNDVSISDPTVGALSCTPQQPASLVPGDKLSCTASHTITQADLDAGSFHNSANASGTPVEGPPVTPPPAEVTVSAAQNPHVTLTKQTSTPNFDHIGQVIAYTIIAANDGNVTLSSVTISDPKVSGLSCTPIQPATLAPGGTLTCTGNHTITQADLDAGSFANTASVTGNSPLGQPVSDTASASVPAAQTASLKLTKTANPTSYDHVDQVVAYTLVATNAGNVTLTGVIISDPTVTPLTCDKATPVTLAPGEQLSCTGSHTIIQADLDTGKVDNTATATGNNPQEQPLSATATVSTPGDQAPHLTLTKQADLTSYSAVGDVIHYTLVVTNDGNVTLSNMQINDPFLATLDCTPAQPTILAPGEALICTGSHTVTQTDLQTGKVDNTATAAGSPPNNTPITAPPAIVSIPAVQLLGAITGVVFNDLNGNQTQDPNETGIGGAIVELLDNQGTIIAIVNTATDGSYRFDNVVPGAYTVVEIDPTGFASTTPNSVSVAISDVGGTASVNFGDQQPTALDPADPPTHNQQIFLPIVQR